MILSQLNAIKIVFTAINAPNLMLKFDFKDLILSQINPFQSICEV